MYGEYEDALKNILSNQTSEQDAAEIVEIIGNVLASSEGEEFTRWVQKWLAAQ